MSESKIDQNTEFFWLSNLKFFIFALEILEVKSFKMIPLKVVYNALIKFPSFSEQKQ